MLVGATAQVTGIGPLVRVKVHAAALHAEVGAVDRGRGGRQMLGRAVMGREFLGCCVTLATAVTLKIHLGSRTLGSLAEACSVVCSKLFLGAEALATLLAVVLLLGEVETQVVLHGQPVRVCGVADIAMVLSDLVEVFVVGQAACMAVCLTTLVAGKGTTPALRLVKFLGPRCSCRGVGLLEALMGMAIFYSHSVALGGLSSHTLHL